MNKMSNDVHEHDAITKTLQPYIDGMKSGRGDDMKPAFHKDATIFGYAGDDLFGGPIQQLFDWSDQSEPATELLARIASIDLAKQLPPFGSNSPISTALGTQTCSPCSKSTANGRS